jgi:hypothetical protein
MFETANFATTVVNDRFKNQKVKDFYLSEDIMVILLGNNYKKIIMRSYGRV